MQFCFESQCVWELGHWESYGISRTLGQCLKIKFINYLKGFNKNYSPTPCFAKTNLMAKGYGHLKKGDGREKFDSHSFKPSS